MYMHESLLLCVWRLCYMIAKYRYGGKAIGGNVRREEDPAFGKYSKHAFRAYLVVFDVLLFVLNLLHRVYVVRYFFLLGLSLDWLRLGLSLDCVRLECLWFV